jgi:acetolactate synthase-1/2/3 large subunit
MISGAQILARSLRKQGVDTMFFLMGGPITIPVSYCVKEGIRCIDVRHEQAAAMMAHAYGRVTNRVAACAGASGPGTINLATGVATAWADACPLIAIGGASPMVSSGHGIFQECDQLSVFRPISKWAERVPDTRRIPDLVATALRQARSGKRGPAYLDMPADVLYRDIEEDSIVYPDPVTSVVEARVSDINAVREAIKLLEKAERPVIVSGTGVLWSEASPEMRQFVELSGIPFYTTPQGRGVIPEDHDLSFIAARSTAFREADVVVALATRMNYVNSHFKPPRFAADAKLIQINLDPNEIGLTRPCNVGIVGDARAVLQDFVAEGEGRLNPKRYAGWVEKLRKIHVAKMAEQESRMNTDQVPIYPLRLCKEIRDVLARDSYLVVDGREILTFGRQSLPTYEPGHRLNSGTWGTMGVGLPFAMGVKVAHPDKQVLVLHGDGSFGLNGMELDTAVRHKINVVCVVSLNGGWTADTRDRSKVKPGRDLGYTRYDKMAEGLGCHAEYVEEPSQIRPALERAFASGKPALVNVKVDPYARANDARVEPEKRGLEHLNT